MRTREPTSRATTAAPLTLNTQVRTRAKAADVPVFCIDREINATDAATAQILSDSYSGCVDIGKYFVETVGEEGQYIEVLGLPGDNNTWNRSKGFHSVVDRYPGLKMVAQQSADFDRTKALEVMESLLQAHPEINAVFCGNDQMATPGGLTTNKCLPLESKRTALTRSVEGIPPCSSAS